MPFVRPVVLSGGAGTRLWPLSTAANPKQFLALLGEPLFESSLSRLDGIAGVGSPTVVTGEGHVRAVLEASRRAGVSIGAIVVEPAGRNTAPAVVAAALVGQPDDVLVVLPSDHAIADEAGFRRAVESAIELAEEDALVVFGVPPTRPETGYGYIETGAPLGNGFAVARFKEKPDQAEAERMAGDGRHLWNCGMFVFKARRLLAEVERHQPTLLAQVRASVPDGGSGEIKLDRSFLDITPISIDHAVMEKTASAVVIPVDVGWSDIGSWQSVWELSPHDESGNAVQGNVVALDVEGSYVLAGSRQVAVAGVKGLVVVETPEAVLVVPLEKAQLVRDLVARSQADEDSD